MSEKDVVQTLLNKNFVEWLRTLNGQYEDLKRIVRRYGDPDGAGTPETAVAGGFVLKPEHMQALWLLINDVWHYTNDYQCKADRAFTAGERSSVIAAAKLLEYDGDVFASTKVIALTEEFRTRIHEAMETSESLAKDLSYFRLGLHSINTTLFDDLATFKKLWYACDKLTCLDLLGGNLQWTKELLARLCTALDWEVDPILAVEDTNEV
jgi:hypothetical protein